MRKVTRDVAKRLFSTSEQAAFVPGQLTFCCNICGANNCLFARDINREGGACHACGCVMRFRSLVAALTQRLYGQIEVLNNIQPRTDIHGIGMSDHSFYGDRLEKKFSYTNTFFHTAPLLDITNPPDHWMGANDFVISSDVFEHVAPPVQRAFDNLHRLLKPGGAAIFSVPFLLQEDTLEHFPNLYNYTLRELQSGKWTLRNITRGGEIEEFDDLVFHGGAGSTLEMRVFSLNGLVRNFIAAGFSDFRVHSHPAFEHGILWADQLSITISAIRTA